MTVATPHENLADFRRRAAGASLVPMSRRLMSDLLTPVLAYRRLVAPDKRTAPSFLFESVETGGTVGRFSYLGAQPEIEIIARGREVEIIHHRDGSTETREEVDPLSVPRRMTARCRISTAPNSGANSIVPRFAGGWVGYAGYDAVRYLETRKLPFDSAPRDDRGLPDLHFALHRQIAAFDHVAKILHAIHWIAIDEHASVEDAWCAGCDALEAFVDRLSTHQNDLPAGEVRIDTAQSPATNLKSNFDRAEFEAAVRRIKEYIVAGDAFQVVLSQRFERQTSADPFDIYRALRIVNPSPYMIYLQAADSILIASSPEILCREQDGVVTSRPLAGTRRRGRTAEEDVQLEQELKSDAKERAEHIMLVDLGRNDLGRVCEVGSIEIERALEVERYSHVMHLSSTITGRLKEGLDCWDALRATLPVGTVSGAPKIRAMQIIDELEPTRRGPYAGGIGAVGFNGNMDIALALRTMVIPTGLRKSGGWTVHLQAGAGIVADSIPQREFEETVNKAAALGRAIDLAESAFRARSSHS